MIVRWTERASKDALLIYDYVADHSENYADSVYARILRRPNQLIVRRQLYVPLSDN